MICFILYYTSVVSRDSRYLVRRAETKKKKRKKRKNFKSACAKHVHKDNAVSQMEQCICATNYRPFDVTDNFQISVLKILYTDCQNILQELKTLKTLTTPKSSFCIQKLHYR